MSKLSKIRDDKSGISLVEIMVALLVFGMAILGLTSAGVISGAHLRASRADIGAAAAVHYQLEGLRADGYDALVNGSATVDGYPMTWTIQGTNPKKVSLVVLIDSGDGPRPDTFVTYVADPTP